MGQYSAGNHLYKPGGGSSGTNLPDEVLDIDKINANTDRIDSLLGIMQVPDASLPNNPGLWQTVRATTTDSAVSWNGSNWVNFFPVYLQQGTLNNTFLRQDSYANTLDTRYYTQTQLLNDGVLDSRYQRVGGGTAPVTTAFQYNTGYGDFGTGYQTQLSKAGGRVILNLDVGGALPSGAQNTLIGTTPTGYRPKTSIIMVCSVFNGAWQGVTAHIAVGTDGTVKAVNASTTVAAGSLIAGTFTYDTP